MGSVRDDGMPAALFGSWRLVSWKRELVATGEQQDALGPNPSGYITYSENGRVTVLIVAADRPMPSGPPSDQDKLGLFNSMFAYSGTYTADHEKLVHRIDMSWNEAWSGTEQVRFYTLAGGLLTLRGAPSRDALDGQMVVHAVTWAKP
jgi:hypothetical protein